jgi:hypothetical protein
MLRLTTFGGIFSSGHFNISPPRLLEAASAGDCRPPGRLLAGLFSRRIRGFGHTDSRLLRPLQPRFFSERGDTAWRVATFALDG